MAACDAGQPTKKVAETFKVSPAWVRRLKQQRRERGDIVPRHGGGSRGRKIDRARLAALVQEKPDATLVELRDRLGIQVTPWAICKVLQELKLTYKKTIHAAGQDRPDVAARRAAWQVSQLGLDPSKLVFLDETWAKTNMTRLRGRSLRGTRLVAKVPHGHWKTTTLIAALDHQVLRCSTIVDGAVNQDIFEVFIGQVLVPSLAPGEVVVMDNLSSHKGPRVRQLIEAAGATVLYLPPYSPDLNPIEPAFSKVKQLLRSAEHRTQEKLWGGMQPLLDKITPADSQGYFRHCGYTLQVK